MQIFTVDQANRMLPLVRRIVGDVVREHAARAERLLEADRLAASVGVEAAAAQAAVERDVQRHTRELEGFARELQSLGILLKDPLMGLIDFPANLDGRRVLLCWRLGEPSVQFWHDEQSGFAGRQPLVPSLVG